MTRVETRYEPEKYIDKIMFASTFNHITKWERRKTHAKCLVQAKDVATHAARFTSGYWCLKDLNVLRRERPSHPFVDGEWDKFALRMISELISKHTVFKCGNILQAETKKKEEEEEELELISRASQKNHLILVKLIFACNQLCMFFVVKKRGWVEEARSRQWTDSITTGEQQRTLLSKRFALDTLSKQ